MNNQIVNVLYCANSRYAPIVAVSIKSLLINNPELYIRIYIFETDFTEFDKKNMKDLILGFSGRIVFFNVVRQLKELKKYGIPAFHGNFLAYARLLAGEFLPDTVDKVLYLDADTMILGKLSPLFEINMKDSVLGGAKDYVASAYKVNLGINGQNYINTGILLINLKLWREKNCFKYIIKFIKENRKMYVYADQDIINILFHNDLLLLPLQYCVFYPIYRWGSKKVNMLVGDSNYYSDDEVIEAYLHPVVLHITGAVTGHPWEKRNCFEYKSEWMNYLKMTGFYKDFIFFKSSQSLKWKLFNKYGYRLMPFELWFRVFLKREIQNIERRIATVNK